MNHITDDMLRELYIEIASYCLNPGAVWEKGIPYYKWTNTIIDEASTRGIQHVERWQWFQTAKKKANVV